MPAVRQGYVAFLDVLGTKEDSASSDLRHEHAVRRSLKQRIEGWDDDGRAPPIYHPRGGDPYTLVRRARGFSDSFYISAYPEPDAPGWSVLELFSANLASVFRWAVGARRLLRGAVAYGKFVDEADIFLGDAAIEAASWHAACDWAGVIAAPSAEREIERCYQSGPPGTTTWFDRYKIPFKTCVPRTKQVPHYALAWPGAPGDATRELLCARFDQSTLPAVRLKRDNTLRFYDHVSQAVDPTTGERHYPASGTP